jgi:hypothetical protein
MIACIGVGFSFRCRDSGVLCVFCNVEGRRDFVAFWSFGAWGLDGAKVMTASGGISIRKRKGEGRRTIMDRFQTRSEARDQYRPGGTCGRKVALERLPQ